jgi:cytochrome b561
MTSAISTGRKHGYSSLQIAFHWSIVGLVAFQWFLGWPMSQVFDARQAGERLVQEGAAYAHIALGVTILILMLARLGAKLKRPVQVAPDSDHPWARLAGQVNHWIFYIVLIALPLGGILAWFGRSEVAASLHALLAVALPFFIAAHVLGALVHQFVFGDNLIGRIVRPGAGS